MSDSSGDASSSAPAALNTQKADEALKEIATKLIEIFGKLDNTTKIIDDEIPTGRNATTIAQMYRKFLDALKTIGMLKDKEVNKTYAIFYIYIRHIVFRLNYVLKLIEGIKDDANEFNDDKFDTNLIEKYIDTFNTIVNDKDSKIDDKTNLYSNAKSNVEGFKLFEKSETTDTPPPP